MRLTAWTWLIFGILMAGMAGYIYLFVPKDGGPNNAMAVFFFIGIVFIIIGIVKLLFKRVDDKEIFDSVEQSIQKKKEEIIRIPVVENRQNRIEESINQMASKQTNAGHHTASHQHPVQTHQAPQRPHHTNTYSQIHQYKGPVHTPNTGTHAQHPVTHHVQNTSTHSVHNTQHVQNTSDHGIRCHKCSNVNSGHSNYCHKCGNRLR